MARTPRTPGAEQAAAATEAASAPIPQATDSTVADDMPNAIDIDATKINAPVLTKQGWVCPVDKPRFANL
jgi:hypothetical protein